MQSDRRLNHTEQCCSLSFRTGEGQRVKLITAVFSNMRWQWLKETLSWLNCISNQFLLCWGHIPLSVFLGVCSGSWSEVMVYTAMCNHWNISFHGLSAHCGNLHGPRLKARLSACLCATASPSNPDPALTQTSPWEHGMIYSAQLSGSAEICELVKQRSFMVKPQSHNSLFNL